MERQFVIENTKTRERLRKLVNEMTDKELTFVIYDEGWTIAVVLAHLAFGDQRSLAFLRKWQKSGVSPEPPIDIDNINNALLPLFLAIPPRTVANFTVSSAEAIDGELEKADSELTNAMENLASGRLHRARHRKLHIDEIEVFIKAKRGRK
jgi:hypothetical protein